MNSFKLVSPCSHQFKIVYDDCCLLAKELANLVKWWDRHSIFEFVSWNNNQSENASLLVDLANSRWGLLLVDSSHNRWFGPDAVPIILKSLPFGKLAAVAFILPGTMWFTQRLYLLISRKKHNVSCSIRRI